MKNRELDKLLRTAPAPDRASEFWEQLPKRITARIHLRSRENAAVPTTEPKAFPVAWASALGAACLVIAFTLFSRHTQTPDATAGQLRQMAKCYREIEAMFPNQVRSILFDEQGPHLMLAEKADVPQSTALYLKICSPRGCQHVVTFSGQQIRVNGDDCDVLLDAAGNVLLVGRQFAWSSASPARVRKEYRIEARALETPS